MAAKTRTKSSVAPGQLLGYSIQVTRLLHRLLVCRVDEGVDAVSLEVIDDVAAHGKRTLAEQTKSGLSHNPISDSSVDLWKTFYNWLEAIRRGELGIENTKFVLHVVQPYRGAVAEQISAVSSDHEARRLITSLREKYWGKAPLYPQKSELSEELQKFLTPVLCANEDILGLLFINFSLETGTGEPIDSIRKQISDLPISPRAVEPIGDQMLGWVKRNVDSLIAKKKPAVIGRQEFNAQFTACVKATDRSATALPSTATPATRSEIASELRNRRYVAQLKLVDLDDSIQQEAASDYLRAAADRTNWAESGEVFQGHVQEFQDALERAWANTKRVSDFEYRTHPESVQGQQLYFKCCGLMGIRLHGADVPSYFIPGSLHALADSLTIGWHPSYKDKFGPSYAKRSVKKATKPKKDGADK